MKINNITKPLIAGLVILNAIFNVVFFFLILNMKSSIVYIKRDISSIEYDINGIKKSLEDIQDDISDIERNVDSIDYYLR